MNKKIEGNYTLEAAILFPMILFIITALLYTCFLLHDKAVIEEAVHLAVLDGETIAKKDMDPTLRAIDYDRYIKEGIFQPFYDCDKETASLKTMLQDFMKVKVMFAHIDSTMVEIKQNEINVSVDYKFNMPIRGIWAYFKSGGTSFSYKEKKSFDNNEEFIRVFQIGIDMGKELPGADSILEMLQKSINILQ